MIHNKETSRRVMAVLLLMVCISACSLDAAGLAPAGQKVEMRPRILFVHSESTYWGWGRLDKIDKQYHKKLTDAGYWGELCHYDELSEEKLSDYNVVALIHPIVNCGQSPFTDKVNRMITKFTAAGGGLLIMPGSNEYTYPEFHKHVNSFLKLLGAEIYNERIEDKEHLKTIHRFSDFKYCWTKNVKPHPVTEGLAKIWYPLSEYDHWVRTFPMKVDDNWRIIIRGEKTACSYQFEPLGRGKKIAGVYTSEPPLLAVRNFRAGRIVLFTTDARYFITDGYHNLYAKGFILEAGGFRLLTNIYDWLAEPSLAGGKAGVTAENIEAIKHEMAQAELARKNPDKTSWVENFPAYSPGPAVPLRKGVIGLHSSLSDGQSTVQQFCAVAKSLGYDYVVFTESLEKMNRQKYRQLQQACGEESGPDFRAIPGVEFDLPNDKGRRLRGFAIDPTALPDKKDPWSMFAQLLFRLNAGGTIATPGLNQIDPWHIRFWNSLEVYAYRSGRRIDDSLQTYKSLVASGYDLSAVAGYRVYQAEALKDFKGYATYAEAEDLKNLSGHFRTFFISSGPVVREFALKSYRGQSMPEAGYSACNEVGDILCLSLALESRHPLKEVTIYRGKNVFRRFRPQSRSFSRNIWFVCTEGTQLWLRATDEKGGEAVSSYIGLSNLYNDLMCKDNQNNILKERLLETEDCVYLGGWQTARDRGSLEFALPNADVVPASGERATGALPFVKSMPAFLTSAGPVRAPHPRLERYLFSNDCAVFAHKAEDDKMAAESIFTVFRPRVYGSNMVIFDCRVKLKQELKLGETKALEVDLVKAVSEARLGPWPNYVYVDGEGRKNHGKTEELITGRVLPLGKGGVIGFWPNEVGSFGLYVLDENSYSVALTGKRESGPSGPVIQVGYDWPGKTLAKGDELKSRFLLVLGNGLARDDSEIWKVQEAYGLGGSAAAYRTKLDRGKIISNRYPLVLEAEDYGLSGKIAPADLPNELAVMVKGLNSNWDAGVVDGRGEGIRRVGILDGAAYLTIDTSKGCEFRAGNLLVCDNREIRLTLIDVKAGRIRFEAHNPTDKEAAITVTSPFFAELRSTCRLSPCTSEQVIADVDTAGVTEEVGQ